jgi:hypothetical protein
MKQRISVGIDPGLSGVVAAINAVSLDLLEVMDTPVITSEGKRLYDIGGMADAIRHMSLLGDAVVLSRWGEDSESGKVFCRRSMSHIGRCGPRCGQKGFWPEHQVKGKQGRFNSLCGCSQALNLRQRETVNRAPDGLTLFVWRIMEQ